MILVDHVEIDCLQRNLRINENSFRLLKRKIIFIFVLYMDILVLLATIAILLTVLKL